MTTDTTTYPNFQDQFPGAIPVYDAGMGNYVNITTSTTTAVKTSPGVLLRVVVNTGGSGSSIALYDSLTGSGTLIGTMSTSLQSESNYGVKTTKGLTVVTSGGVPADITVVYL